MRRSQKRKEGGGCLYLGFARLGEGFVSGFRTLPVLFLFTCVSLKHLNLVSLFPMSNLKGGSLTILE